MAKSSQAPFSKLSPFVPLGRFINEDDIDAAAANPVCVISYLLWQQRFAGDEHILGRKLLLNAHPYTVIGDTPRGFNGAQLESHIDLQLPVSRIGDFLGGFFASDAGAAMWKSPAFSWLEPFGRRKPGITTVEAEGKLQILARELTLQLAAPEFRQKLASQNSRLRLEDGSGGLVTRGENFLTRSAY